ncbi:hypothetical protein GOBAR_AA18651 [Gossypium barbadense]|uniref:Uncharacterized protein n=1 Tax=Gossypium barbadense TaxID=3634 RepID=A0A2P5XF87_GOSBA|nr:hypothetical protein GOBAR_AA18651 [Gossypium barbadense]
MGPILRAFSAVSGEGPPHRCPTIPSLRSALTGKGCPPFRVHQARANPACPTTSLSRSPPGLAFCDQPLASLSPGLCIPSPSPARDGGGTPHLSKLLSLGELTRTTTHRARAYPQRRLGHTPTTTQRPEKPNHLCAPTTFVSSQCAPGVPTCGPSGVNHHYAGGAQHTSGRTPRPTNQTNVTPSTQRRTRVAPPHPPSGVLAPLPPPAWTPRHSSIHIAQAFRGEQPDAYPTQMAAYHQHLCGAYGRPLGIPGLACVSLTLTGEPRRAGNMSSVTYHRRQSLGHCTLIA